MSWFFAAVVAIGACIAALRFWRSWIRPWRDLEQLVADVINGRAPRTYLLSGNRSAERIGIALEDVFLRQRDLANRAAEDELNIRTILGAMRDGLAVLDEEGRVQLLNAAARELFAIGDERGGANVIETFRDPLVANVTTRTLHNRETATESINVRGQSTSEDRRVAVTSLPMQGKDGEVCGAVVLFHDVTHLQQLEQVRREFVSNVSHELRTPLSIFRGYIETLLDEPGLAAEERERILRVMEKHSSRLHSLVDDLLSLARLEAPDRRVTFAPVPLAAFLPRVAKDWEKKAAAKQLRIALEVDRELPPISADEARLEEIVYNLLDNAVKYSNAGGQIVIRASRADAKNIAFSVTDQGTGIASSDLPRIFERFYRADKARSREVGGTGLGLAIVKHIAQLHGGFVEAESQLGRGTTIRVVFPVGPV
jgi:two-component system phosphate regulon sensor histidine kinase PhoR